MNKTPKSGDVVDFGDYVGAYPFIYGRFGRIDRVYDQDDISICCEQGSAFYEKDGSVSISGGPFHTVGADMLIPTDELFTCRSWNWGNNRPGAGMGVHFDDIRPVWKLRNPVDIEIRA